jgi:Mrp family chromosome partitioning ATPase/capsular polysaccharide biosynthesis protein
MNETTDAGAIVAPLWRFKWLILVVGLLVAGGTWLHYSGGKPVFSTTTQLNLYNGYEEQGIPPPVEKRTGKRGGNGPGVVAAGIINSPLIHASLIGTLRALNTPLSLEATRGASAAAPKEKTQFVIISANAPSAASAALLANITAQTYVNHVLENEQRGLRSQLIGARQQLASTEVQLAALPPGSAAAEAAAPPPSGKKGKRAAKSVNNTTSLTLQAASLQSKIGGLEAALKVVPVRQIAVASPQSAVESKTSPKQNAIFGFVIGIFLASIAAYTLNRFDRRIRTLSGLERVFGVQVLAALPATRRPLGRQEGELRPTKPLREPLRRLHVALKLGPSLNGRGARPSSVLILSPDAADGKSTLAAGLSLILREGGERVSLIEADFRRPVQSRLFGLPPRGGLLEVLAGALTLDEALQPVESAFPDQPELEPYGGVATLARPQSTGALSLLLGDVGVPNPPALLAEPTMAELVRAAADEFDFVLIDAPPPLMVSDAMALLRVVDGIILVGRIGHTREASAARLVDLLAREKSAPILGVVANGVRRTDMEHYGLSLGYGRRSWFARILGR